jgi:DNA-directed RNA polymerase specialized sigma24 family protein
MPSRPDFSGIDAPPTLKKEEARLLKEALFFLSFEEKCLLFLRDGRHLSYEDVATVLRLPLKDVKLKVLAARSALREKMRKLLGDSGGL